DVCAPRRGETWRVVAVGRRTGNPRVPGLVVGDGIPRGNRTPAERRDAERLPELAGHQCLVVAPQCPLHHGTRDHEARVAVEVAAYRTYRVRVQRPGHQRLALLPRGRARV